MARQPGTCATCKRERVPAQPRARKLTRSDWTGIGLADGCRPYERGENERGGGERGGKRISAGDAEERPFSGEASLLCENATAIVTVAAGPTYGELVTLEHRHAIRSPSSCGCCGPACSWC